MNEFNPLDGAPQVPDEIQKRLGDALLEVCIFFHDITGSSHLMLSIQHTSDAIAKRQTTSVAVMGGGTRVGRAAEQKKPLTETEKADVDALLKKMMDEARAKAGSLETKKDPEPPKLETKKDPEPPKEEPKP